MERFEERRINASKSLEALQEVLDERFTKIVRDATIQRFEFTVESVWKFAQLYLREREGIDIASPKGVFRSCFQVQVMSEEHCKTALEMIDDRNLTVHTYNEALAEKIFKRIPEYHSLMKTLFASIVSKAHKT